MLPDGKTVILVPTTTEFENYFAIGRSCFIKNVKRRLADNPKSKWPGSSDISTMDVATQKQQDGVKYDGLEDDIKTHLPVKMYVFPFVRVRCTFERVFDSPWMENYGNPTVHTRGFQSYRGQHLLVWKKLRLCLQRFRNARSMKEKMRCGDLRKWRSRFRFRT
ncbi:Hypothetical protein NTJ_15765 [Nesidiocoris tenuis]|nr:Hypothetical protein NTJ_15765 [Nesidiocoris tenuis]